MPTSRPCLQAAAIIAGCLVVATGATTAEGRFRTPAEIELRRAAVAERLVALAEAESLLRRRLVTIGEAIDTASEAEQPVLEQTRREIESGLATLAEERSRLTEEGQDLAAAVTRTATGPLTFADPRGLSPVQVPGTSAQVTSGTAFNPAVTVIPDGLYYYDNAGGVAETRGFSLREVELAFSGAVDPYFDVWASFGIGDGAIETEEVYVQTRRLLPGMQVRFGQFFSGVGFLNRQHRHQWDFVDQALPYEKLFGQQLGEVGVQLTWLPALPIYTQFGVEALQGDNSLIANQLSEQYPDLLDETPGPRLFTGFVKVSPDLGYSNTLQGGVSAGRSRSHQEAETSGPRAGVYDGTSWFVGTDWIWRRDSARSFGERDLSVQGEYVYRSTALEPAGIPQRPEFVSRQDGLYVQVVYGIAPRWTVAGRFDTTGDRDRIPALTGLDDVGSATRYATNVTFNPTEFSRLRLQYNNDSTGDRGRMHQLYVQFQMSLGAHGAHQF